MRRRWLVGGLLVCALSAVGLYNCSALAPRPEGAPGVLAHRGIHQTFPAAGVTRDTCTAKRIYPPTNPYLENTLPSMAASFAAGATVLELDVHPTTDGEFAVFHDWRLECRTNGVGVTRQRSMAYLKSLDIGYGYTADNGRTFPFRGKGQGLMPTLAEVLQAFPDRRFLLNIKSNDPNEADLLLAYLAKHGVPLERHWVYAVRRPRERLAELAPKLRLMSEESMKSCSAGYILTGWSGRVPESCRGGFMAIPTNLRWLFWGWPDRLLERTRQADVEVLLVGPVGQGNGRGIDDVFELEAVPTRFSGHVITDRIEIIGPALRERSRGSAR